ncbi:MAG: nucleoside recognition domain-containing protein, partial [Candidatus Omnitrophica bacterium]|nr:nucleoside recognition domain-containing protein [Candidatus Omnitrophota bacterium]
ISSLATIYSLSNNDANPEESLLQKLKNDRSWNPLKAVSFLLFCLIYLPCVAAMAVVYRETGSSLKWLLFLIVWTTSLAWIVSFVVYQTGLLLGF